MHLSAVEHIPMSQYAFALDESTLVLRLRSSRGDLVRCTLRYGDRAISDQDFIFAAQPMAIVAQETLYDWFETTLTVPFARVCYYFELDDGAAAVDYWGDPLKIADTVARSDYFQFPYIHRNDLADVPAWAKDAIVYNIFPDSFASGKRSLAAQPGGRAYQGIPVHSHLGGTLEGILQNLDYIDDLGFTLIYLNPIFAAESYHKYDLLDYYHIDPCFGTDEQFRKLVASCHARGIKVLIDGVFNHAGWNFFAFADVVENGRASKYWDWFYDVKEPVRRPAPGQKPDYACFAYVPQMPKTNTANPELRDYFCNVGRYWIREFGIDGWRLDVANEVDDAFWRAFNSAVRAEKQDALIIGEVWENASHYMERGLMDSAMNYDLRKYCRRFFAEQRIDACEFDACVTQMRMRYRTPYAFTQLNLLDSHDVSRFLSLCRGDESRLRLAVVFQMTFIGMPCVLYGDEQGLTGVSENEYRRPIPWGEAFHPLHAFYRTLIAIRKSHDALRRGTYQTLSAAPGSKLYVYCREDASERVIIAVNCGDDAQPYRCGGRILLQSGWQNGILQPQGYAITID